MSQDIRSYFFSSKQNLKQSNLIENKPHKKVNTVKISEEDDVHNSFVSDEEVLISKKKKVNKKPRSRKRILSSDEDNVEVTSPIKNKKTKVVEKESSKHVEKLIEVDDSEKFLSKKPVKRLNAIKVSRKPDIKTTNISALNHNVNFINESDEFEATLNQLDTSQIEDEYLSTINNTETPFFKLEEKECISNKKNIKEIPITSSYKDKDKEKIQVDDNKEISESNSIVNQSTATDQICTKHEKLGKKKMRNDSNIKLKIQKNSATHKLNRNSVDTECNEQIKINIEKKKHNAILYQNYLNRGGARNPGSKEIPQGSDNCLANLTFLITGVLDSLERTEAEDIIKNYGGKIAHSVTKKLNYIIVGDDAGPSKLAKAESIGIKRITEDDFLNLLRTRQPEIKECSSNYNDTNKNKRKKSSNCDSNESQKIAENKNDSFQKESNKNINNKTSVHFSKNSKEIEESNKSSLKIKSKISSNPEPSKIETKRENSPIKTKIDESLIEIKENKEIIPNLKDVRNKINYSINYTDALVEKYRPKELKQIIGQNSEKSNAKKLQYWLTNWYKNHGKNGKIKKNKFTTRDDTGAIYKAVLLSGPPGIGKTTTAYVVCKQLGYEILEFNASDTRSKKLLQEEITDILYNKSIKAFFTNIPNEKEILLKHVLLMDEVDGMAGNEDRGGMQELIAFIKSTEIPIICICNDRNSQKIKTLANYTFDLRFQKPKLEHIRAAMMSMCFKEKIKITPEELSFIIQSTNQDIRQVINQIALLSAKLQIITSSKENIKYKNLKLGPWDVVRKVFSSEEHKKMSIHDKSDLFFHDYNIAALFVQENYPIITPIGSKCELHKKLANCSESLAIGDIIESNIRINQSWNLLPVQACFSSVIPGSEMSGFFNSQINFPNWLGKNSKTLKCDRLLQDITVNARITTGANKEAINLDYSKILLDSIMRSLIFDETEGIEKALNIMNTYHLSKEDLDSLIELTKWPHTRDPMQSVNSKTKTAFTKAYNKSILFSSVGRIRKKYVHDNESEDLIENIEVSDDDDDDNKLENDKLIKAKISKTRNARSENKNKIKNIVKINKVRAKK